MLAAGFHVSVPIRLLVGMYIAKSSQRFWRDSIISSGKQRIGKTRKSDVVGENRSVAARRRSGAIFYFKSLLL